MLVTVMSHAGIANRIKNIMSAMSQFEEVGTLHEPINYILPSVKLLNDVVNPYEENWRLYISPDEEKYTETYKTIDLLYEETPQYFIEKYSNIIKRLKINQDIIDCVNDFTKDWKDMVGVHIRSWYCERRRLHSNQIFEEEIDKISSNQKFFFCSDNSDVQKYFIGKYGDRINTFQRQMFNDYRLAESGHHDDIQITTDAFIELLLLSKCDKIIGTYASSFDEVAWWMGGCKSKVIIPKPNNFDKELHNLIYVKK